MSEKLLGKKKDETVAWREGEKQEGNARQSEQELLYVKSERFRVAETHPSGPRSCDWGRRQGQLGRGAPIHSYDSETEGKCSGSAEQNKPKS